MTTDDDDDKADADRIHADKDKERSCAADTPPANARLAVGDLGVMVGNGRSGAAKMKMLCALTLKESIVFRVTLSPSAPAKRTNFTSTNPHRAH